jgi:hypothetical protein
MYDTQRKTKLTSNLSPLCDEWQSYNVIRFNNVPFTRAGRPKKIWIYGILKYMEVLKVKKLEGLD